MWQVISNIASVLSIISAIVTLCSALAIKSYYNKITTLYSVEKLTVAEQKSIEAKKTFQGLKEMYMTPRGRKAQHIPKSICKLIILWMILRIHFPSIAPTPQHW